MRFRNSFFKQYKYELPLQYMMKIFEHSKTKLNNENSLLVLAFHSLSKIDDVSLKSTITIQAVSHHSVIV